MAHALATGPGKKREAATPGAQDNDRDDGETLMKRIYVLGTADTKGEELAFLADAVAASGGMAVRV
ncbi:hypothetical protein EN829_065020, partial [Mesorhizobium sp. M00.F.Ca.ET.186.01.1.1]